MSATIIDGNEIAQRIRRDISKEVKKLRSDGITPHLSVILVGDDPASQSYVNGKKRASNEVNISSDIITLPENVSEEELLNHIKKLNNDNSVHDILDQLPLPQHIDEHKIIEMIHTDKYVDRYYSI